MASMMACHSYGILKINNWVFCHGGLLPHHVDKRSITWINKLVKNVLSGSKTLENLTQEEQNYLYGNDSFFWTRFYSQNADRCSVLNRTLDLVNNTHNEGGMVVGHTPHNNITDVSFRFKFPTILVLSLSFKPPMDKSKRNEPNINKFIQQTEILYFLQHIFYFLKKTLN